MCFYFLYVGIDELGMVDELRRVGAELITSESDAVGAAMHHVAVVEWTVDAVARAVQTVLEFGAARFEETARVGQFDHDAAGLFGVVFEIK